jgi:hypothetical protein
MIGRAAQPLIELDSTKKVRLEAPTGVARRRDAGCPPPALPMKGPFGGSPAGRIFHKQQALAVLATKLFRGNMIGEG